MSQRFDFIFFLLIISFFSLKAQNANPIPPEHPARTLKIDVRHINLDLRFDWEKKQLQGVAGIRLNLLNASQEFSLDAGMLSIQRIQLENGKALTFEYSGGAENDALKIKLDRPYRPEEEIFVSIEYHSNWVNASDPNNLWGSYGKGLRFFGPSTTDPKKRRQIWSVGEAESNRYWFPCHDTPGDLRTTDITATLEKGLTFIANGALVERIENSDGSHKFHWKMDRPYANHLSAIVVGAYDDFQQFCDEIKLHSYGYPDEKEATVASVERLPDMMRFYSEMTGVKYPFSDYTQVFVQDFAGFMGNAGFSTITENMVDDYPTHAEFYYLWDITEGEALAQQWFGHYLSVRDWRDAWLNKSFAHYLSGLYNAHKNGKEEYLLYQWLYDLNTVYLGDWNSGIRRPLVTQNYSDAQAFSGDNYSSTYGAMVLRMLHQQLGDDKWWKSVRQYLTVNAGKPVSTQDFLRAVSESSGESLDWFFDQWVFRMGHPVFEISKNYDPESKQLQLLVRQAQQTDTGNAFPQTAFLQGNVNIQIDGKIEKIWLDAKAENTFLFSCPQAPKLVHFDYENAWIKEFSFKKSLEELLYQAQYDGDILGKRWAMGELVKLAQQENRTSDDKDKIYAALRNIALSKDYWRLRYTALSQLQSLLATPGKALSLDKATTKMLFSIIQTEKAWLRSAAITFLGMTEDRKYADLYLKSLNDSCDRVINASATALGKCKSSRAFHALSSLVKKPSWKNQSLISALNGLKALGDPRAYDIAYKALCNLDSPHWTLATPVWDYRLAAAETITALGKSADAYPFMFECFKKSMAENDIHGIFYNALLITTLADPKGMEIFGLLKEKYKDDADALTAVQQLEMQLAAAIRH